MWTFFHVWEYETKDCLSDGRCAESNIFDIIGPWVEPETVDLWVNLDGDGASSSESSRDRAEAIAADDRTHLYHITGPADAPDFKVVWTAEGGEQDG
ncbi:conserved hypothetical protein [Ahrensia sp. R2A130]|nr:conserved hypothetical protein [Ahrensia sp. R2A130]